MLPVLEQEHEGGNRLSGDVEGEMHCMAQESDHTFFSMGRMAERLPVASHREGITVCPKDLVTAICAGIGVVDKVKLKLIGETSCRDHASFMRG